MGDTEMYLKTQQVADALGVSSSTVKRWVNRGAMEATRTLGKHRLVPLSGAIEFARRENLPVDVLLAIAGQASRASIDERTIESLLHSLKAGNKLDATRLIASVYGTSRDAVSLGDLLIRPVMERIGHGWMVGAWDVYQEHQATSIVATAVSDLIARVGPGPEGSGPLAIGAAAEGDHYTLPILLGELVLREGGWRVRNLGPNLPLRSLARAARDLRPKLVFLSASHIEDRERFLHEYSFFYEAASLAGSAIILGGRAMDPELRSRMVYASFGERMAHLAEFARRLAPTTGAALDPGPDQTRPAESTN